MKNKKGFTLIELLAVIVILAIIALITVPTVLNIIDKAKKGAATDSAYGVEKAADYYYLGNVGSSSFTETTFTCNGTACTSNLDSNVKLDIGGTVPTSGTIIVRRNGKVETSNLVINGYSCEKTNGVYNCGGSEEPVAPILYKDTVLNGADPVLDTGMIPVIIGADGTLTKADLYSEWYDYTNKEWANVVLVSDATRNTYINASVGSTINQLDILGYFVWIPRYKYQIFYDGNILMDQDYNTNTTELINITFENKNTTKSNGSLEGEWLTHPAFTFGSEELNGYWVAKFETTGDATTPTSLPNIISLREQDVSTQFTTSLKFKDYGIANTDSHMMKNMEWGAVAYLTTSIYGQGLTEVRINNSSQYITGCAATTPATTKAYSEYLNQSNGSEGYYDGCENAYNTSIGYLASTTGNITGIYDMSGGAWEYVMGVMEDVANTNIPMSGYNVTYNSGFNGLYTNNTLKEDGISFPNAKYYDIYNYGTTYRNTDAYSRGKLGDATIELGSFTKHTSDNDRPYSTWNKDYAYFVYSGYPWFRRGGYFSDGTGSGLFAFSFGHGGADSTHSFRVVLSE